MANKKTSRQRVNKKLQPSLQPRRKVGRYVLLVAFLIPMFIYFQPQKYIAAIDVELPSMNFDDEMAISNVIIDGDLRYVTRQSVQTDISALLASDFVRLDLRAMRNELEAKPWYRTVRLARQWPSTLKVFIEEEQPIARWGQRGFINRYGELVELDELAALASLPLLEGLDREAYDIAKSYLLMSQLVNEQGLYISALSVDPSGEQKITFSAGFDLLLGQQKISQRLEKFLYLYKHQLAQNKEQLAHIDMRYESGVAVRWLNEPNSEIASR